MLGRCVNRGRQLPIAPVPELPLQVLDVLLAASIPWTERDGILARKITANTRPADYVRIRSVGPWPVLGTWVPQERLTRPATVTADFASAAVLAGNGDIASSALSDRG